MDLDLRKIRYFVAVAEHLNYGRAAIALHIAQPVLSRQIRALESELNAQLFLRDGRGTELTAAGRQLLADSVPLLAAAAAAQRRVDRAAHGGHVFIVAFMPGLIVTAPVRALSAAHPQLRVDVLRTGWHDQTEVIRDGQADVSLVRLPVDRAGLTVEPLFREPRVVALPADHRLAGKQAVGLADLAGERLLQHPDAVPEWREVDQGPRSRVQAPALNLQTVEEKLEHVAAGHGVVVLPESAAAYYRRPDVVDVRLADIGPNEVALAWDTTRRSTLISEFAALAAEHRHGLVPGRAPAAHTAGRSRNQPQLGEGLGGTGNVEHTG